MTNNFMEWILNIIEISISSGLVIGVVYFIAKKYLGSKIENIFNKKLEKYKQQLDLSTESARFDFQRKIQDFSLYTVKKHKTYLKLHKLLLEAEAHICGLYGGGTELTYQEHNEKDIRNLMENENFPEGKIEEIFNVWNQRGKDSAIKRMKNFLRIIEVQKADNSYIFLKNYFWNSKLYFSKKVEEKSNEIVNLLGSLMAHYETLERMSFETKRKQKDSIERADEIKSKVRPSIDELILIIKSELAVGYYQIN